MISLLQYLGPWVNHPDFTDDIETNSLSLLMWVSKLIEIMEKDGVIFPINPNTKSIVAGNKYGGFRPQACSQGAPKSAHKLGLAVDIWDPENKIDEWLMDHQPLLTALGIYIEHPDYTKGWSHWSIKAPKSGHHVFIP